MQITRFHRTNIKLIEAALPQNKRIYDYYENVTAFLKIGL